MSIMCDWLSGVINIRHKCIKQGEIVSIDQDGEVEYRIAKRQTFEGSYSTKFTLKSQGEVDEHGYSNEIYFSGNPSKFLQGHNVFGTDNVFSLLVNTIDQCDLNRQLLDIDRNDLMGAARNAKITRLDLNDALQFESQNQVRAYIKQLSLIAHTRNGRPQQKGWTLKFNPSSRRWKLIVYSKGDEIKNGKAKLKDNFPDKEFLEQEAQKMCRIELRLLSEELKDLRLNTLKEITSERIAQVYENYVGRVKMSEQVKINSAELSNLKPVIRSTYLSWIHGVDMSAVLKQPTFYRHRSELLKHGVDISIPHQETGVNNVIPLKTVIVGQPYQIPTEAYKRGLVFTPNSTLRAI